MCDIRKTLHCTKLRLVLNLGHNPGLCRLYTLRYLFYHSTKLRNFSQYDVHRLLTLYIIHEVSCSIKDNNSLALFTS